MAKRQAFVARLVPVGAFYGVAVPRAVSRALGGRGHVPVVLRVNGAEPVRTSLLPDGNGGHLVYVNGSVRKAAAVSPGDRLSVELAADLEPRGATLPPDLANMLAEEGVTEAWWSMAPGRREQMLRWIEQAAHESTRARRLATAVERAHAQREKLVDRGEGAPPRRTRGDRARSGSRAM